MEWHEKFKVGERVKVVKKVSRWKYGNSVTWNLEGDMDSTVGKIYKIVQINRDIGYQLLTKYDTYHKQDYWYPVESLRTLVGQQLLFSFMEG